MRSYDQYCGLALALDRIGERWTLLIVRELLTGPKRYVDLCNGLPSVATNLLSNRLKGMEADGLITRKLLPPPAASTVYTLTDLGLELEDAVHALIRWGGNFMGHRSDGQNFQTHWLPLALQSVMTHAPAAGNQLTVAINLPEGTTTLRFEESGIRIVPEDGEPDLRLHGRAELVLGLASGFLTWDSALASGLSVTGPDPKIAALRSLFYKT